MQYRHNPYLTPAARELRKNMTKEERHLWYDFLRSYPIRFYRQRVIDHYIADFYCSQVHLVIELDGSQHYTEEGLVKDRIRTERLAQWGLTVLRIPNYEVHYHFQEVCEYIDQWIKDHTPPTPPSKRGQQGETAPAPPL